MPRIVRNRKNEAPPRNHRCSRGSVQDRSSSGRLEQKLAMGLDAGEVAGGGDANVQNSESLLREAS